MNTNINDAIEGFLKALAFTGIFPYRNAITIDYLGCPHVAKGLPAGKMAIYTFQKDDVYLKIGKAGPNSPSRFQNQHYSPNSTRSNLAKSLLADKDMAVYNLNKDNIGNWIRQNVTRIDILIDQDIGQEVGVFQDVGIFILNFLESYLHCRFTPKYEGFENQR